MARQPRLQFEDAFYHVYSRGNGRARIFWTDVDYSEFEDMLLDLADRCNVNLYDWHLMPNHFHLLLETPDANLSEFMQRLLSRYAQSFNRRHRRVGHVFQGRYGARICDPEEYLLKLIQYIALQSHRAKNSHALLRDGRAPWAASRYYLDGNEPEIARPYIHAVLRRFNDDITLARASYKRFIADGLSNPDRILKLPPTKAFLGSDRFIEESKQKARAPIRRLPRPTWQSLDALVQAVWEAFGITEAQLCSTSKNLAVAGARRALAYAARKLWRHPVKAIAIRLHKDPSAVSQMIRRQEEERDNTIMQVILNVLDGKPQY